MRGAGNSVEESAMKHAPIGLTTVFLEHFQPMGLCFSGGFAMVMLVKLSVLHSLISPHALFKGRSVLTLAWGVYLPRLSPIFLPTTPRLRDWLGYRPVHCQGGHCVPAPNATKSRDPATGRPIPAKGRRF